MLKEREQHSYLHEIASGKGTKILYEGLRPPCSALRICQFA